jgi:hypothetical protein
MHGDGRIDQIAPECPQPRQCAILVRAGKPASRLYPTTSAARIAASFRLSVMKSFRHNPARRRVHARRSVEKVSRLTMEVCELFHGCFERPAGRHLPAKGKIFATLLLQCMSPNVAHRIISARCGIWSLSGHRWGNRPAILWIAEDFGCCASG